MCEKIVAGKVGWKLDEKIGRKSNEAIVEKLREYLECS
jgi:hypothetical protein